MNTQEKKKPEDSISRAMTGKELAFTAPIKPMSGQQLSVWVRALLQNWRQGTVGVKGRADVSLSTKKPWKQKGTGRARAGTARSPLWRGGGVTFGPQKRSKVLSISKKARKQVLAQIIAERIQNNRVIALDFAPQGDRPKTKAAAQALKQASLLDKKITLLLSPHDMITYSSFVNIPCVQVLLFDQPNAYDLINCEYWVCLNKDLDAFKEAVKQWQ